MNSLPCICFLRFQLLQRWSGCCFSPTQQPAVRQMGNPKRDHEFIQAGEYRIFKNGKTSQKKIPPKNKNQNQNSNCL